MSLNDWIITALPVALSSNYRSMDEGDSGPRAAKGSRRPWRTCGRAIPPPAPQSWQAQKGV